MDFYQNDLLTLLFYLEVNFNHCTLMLSLTKQIQKMKNLVTDIFKFVIFVMVAVIAVSPAIIAMATLNFWVMLGLFVSIPVGFKLSEWILNKA